MARSLALLNRLLLLGLLSFALWGWPRLPDEIPLHFGISGRPDRWGPPDALSWFLLPGLAVVLVLAMEGVPRLLARHSQWVNLPGGKRLSEYPQELHGPVLDVLAGLLALVQTQMLVLFALIQVATWQAAQGRESQGLILLALALAVLASPFLLVYFFLRLQRVTGRVGRARSAGAAPGPPGR